MNTEKFYEYWRAWFAQPAEAKEPFRRVKENPCRMCGGTGRELLEDPHHGHAMYRTCTACGGAGKIDRGNWYPPFSESPGYTGKPDPKEYVHITQKDFGLRGWVPVETENVFYDCLDSARAWLDERGLADLAWGEASLGDCVLRILHYLPTPNWLACETHRDFDLLTVNVGGTCPGLEVLCECSKDAAVPCAHWQQREGGIHVGEMLEIYTAADGAGPRVGRLYQRQTATPHRVRIPPNTERFAAVFFYNPPDDFVLRPGLTAKQYRDDVMGRAGTAQGARR